MDSIYSEVREFVQGRVESGVVTRVDWLTAEYIGTKDNVAGADLPFYRICAQAHVIDIVKRVVGKYDAKPTQTDKQLVLPGFDHLQKAYTVVRDGAVVLVPIAMLTTEELRHRAEEYDVMAKGCRAHAREIREFINARGESFAA